MSKMPVGAYIHAKPDGTPFYVGKGTVRRSKMIYGRNPYYERVVAKIGKENVLVGRIECSSDEIAFQLECGIIKCLKNSGVELTNLTIGGLGGLQHQVPWSKGKKFTAEHRAKLSAARLGKKPWNIGKAWSEEQRAKLAEAAKNRKKTRVRNDKGQYQ